MAARCTTRNRDNAEPCEQNADQHQPSDQDMMGNAFLAEQLRERGPKEEAAAAFGGFSFGDLIGDMFGTRDNEAGLDLCEEITGSLEDFQDGIQDVQKFVKNGLRDLMVHQEVAGLVDNFAVYCHRATVAVRDGKPPEGVDLATMAKIVKASVSEFTKNADNEAYCLMYLEKAAGEVGGAMGMLCPGPAGAMVALANTTRLSTLQQQIPSVSGLSLDQLTKAKDQLTWGIDKAAEVIAFGVDLIPFEFASQRKTLGEFGQSLKKYHGVIDKVNKAENLMNFVAAVIDVADVDLTDRSDANRRLGAAKLARLFETSGAVGSDFGHAFLKPYAGFIQEMGKSNFFSQIINANDPAVYYGEQFDKMHYN